MAGSSYEGFESELSEGNFVHKHERDAGSSFGMPAKKIKNKSNVSSSIDSDMRVEYSEMDDDIDETFE